MSQRSLRVAVVDNDRAYVEMMCDVLTNAGFEVVVYRSSSAARRAIPVAPPDLVILDLWIEQPGTGGELVEALRSHPSTQTTPVVICSGDIAQLSRYVCSPSKSICATLTKPFELDDLFGAVRRLTAPSIAKSVALR